MRLRQLRHAEGEAQEDVSDRRGRELVRCAAAGDYRASRRLLALHCRRMGHAWRRWLIYVVQDVGMAPVVAAFLACGLCGDRMRVAVP